MVVDEDMKILKPLYIASAVENSALENSLTVLQRVQHISTIWFAKSLLGKCTEKNRERAKGIKV